MKDSVYTRSASTRIFRIRPTPKSDLSHLSVQPSTPPTYLPPFSFRQLCLPRQSPVRRSGYFSLIQGGFIRFLSRTGSGAWTLVTGLRNKRCHCRRCREEDCRGRCTLQQSQLVSFVIDYCWYGTEEVAAGPVSTNSIALKRAQIGWTRRRKAVAE